MQREVEYARANALFDRTMLVYVHSAASSPRTLTVTLNLPAGLKADSATRTLTLPAFGDANLYFRVQGRLAPGRHPVRAVATVNGKTVERRLRADRVFAHPAAPLLSPGARFSSRRSTRRSRI